MTWLIARLRSVPAPVLVATAKGLVAALVAANLLRPEASEVAEAVFRLFALSSNSLPGL